MWLLNTLVILSVFGAIFCDDTEVTVDDDGFSILKNDTFETFIKENEYVLVEFYTQPCERCEKLAAECVKAAKELEEKGTKVVLSKVNGDDESKLVADYLLEGYPTLKFFRRGATINYPMKVDNTGDEILQWLTKKTGFPATEIKSVDGAEEFIKSQPVVVIGFFDDLETDAAKTYVKVADVVDDYPFGYTSNKDVYAKYEVKSGSIILFKNFDEGKAVFDGEIEEETITNFLGRKSLPFVVDFNRETSAKIGRFFGDMKSHLLFFVSKTAGHYEQYIQPASDVAKEYREKILFLSIDIDDIGHKRFLKMFGLKDDEFPSMLLLRVETELVKYRPVKAQLSPENIRSFVEDFLDGKLKPHLPSQDLPEDWDKNPVKILVGTNFDEVVFNSEKNVLVEFYAPWCTVCQQLEPIYNDLGEQYKDSNDIIIAKIDTTVNELLHTKVTNVPTLKLYKKGGNNTGIVFQGRPTLEGLVYFLESGGEQETILEPAEKLVTLVDPNEEAEGEKVEEDEEGEASPKEEL